MLLVFLSKLSRLVLLAGFLLSVMAFGIGLQPTTVEMEVVPGERNRQVVNIANVHTEQTISLTLGLADWTLDANGQIRLSPPGETENSSADWVRFSPAFITLKPGESQQIIVDIATPTRLPQSGDFRFALLASTILPEERGGQSGVWKKYQIATLFYLTTGAANSEPKILSSSIVQNQDGSRSLQLGIENTGNAHARLHGQIEIGQGANPKTLEIGNVVVLDQGYRDYVTQLPENVTAATPIEVKLRNVFAPQSNDGQFILPPYLVPQESWNSPAKPPAKSESLP